MRTIALAAAVLALAGSPAIHADEGHIPYRSDVRVFEPTQRALIAWNGAEEILILSTDLYASEATEALEVLPLPAEPVVTEADVEIFSRATELINRKQRERAGREAGESLAAKAPPAGEVTFHEKIGSHDVSVPHVLDAAGFVAWVNTALRRSGVEAPVIPPVIAQAVEDYLADGYEWFVFAVVSLEGTPRTREAIQYRFKSRSLYYPLRITRSAVGPTEVQLLILTPRLLSRFAGSPIGAVKLVHEPVPLISAELAGLSEEVHALFGHRPEMRLRIWRFAGETSSFKRDVVVN